MKAAIWQNYKHCMFIIAHIKRASECSKSCSTWILFLHLQWVHLGMQYMKLQNETKFVGCYYYVVFVTWKPYIQTHYLSENFIKVKVVWLYSKLCPVWLCYYYLTKIKLKIMFVCIFRDIFLLKIFTFPINYIYWI